MVWDTWITYKIEKTSRVCHVWYLDDSEARAEAITFFNNPSVGALFGNADIPDLELLHGIPIDEANEFLKEHPVQHHWTGLHVFFSQLADEDLDRLQHLPELKFLFIRDVTNEGLDRVLYRVPRKFDPLFKQSDRSLPGYAALSQTPTNAGSATVPAVEPSWVC